MFEFELSSSQIIHQIYLIWWKHMHIQFFFLLIAAPNISGSDFLYIRFYLLSGPINFANICLINQHLIFLKIIFSVKFWTSENTFIKLYYYKFWSTLEIRQRVYPVIYLLFLFISKFFLSRLYIMKLHSNFFAIAFCCC